MPLSFFNQLFETNRKGNRGTERARAGAPERVAGGGADWKRERAGLYARV
jgi:hypothetical protein